MTTIPALTTHEADTWRLVRLARLQAALEQCEALGLVRLARVQRLHDHKGTLAVTADALTAQEQWLVQALWLHVGNEPRVEFIQASDGRWVA